MSDAQHTDALARLIESGHYIPGNPSERDMLARDDARRILDSTDPEVHEALLDALTRHGVPKPQMQVMFRDPGTGELIPWNRVYQPQQSGTFRRLVTRWEPLP